MKEGKSDVTVPARDKTTGARARGRQSQTKNEVTSESGKAGSLPHPVADQLQRSFGNQAVVRAIESGAVSNAKSPGLTCDSGRVQSNPKKGDTSTASGLKAPPIVHQVLKSSGEPLDAAARSFMEPRFGRDFRDVRVHRDALAAKSADAIDARAYTIGKDVVFGSNEYGGGASAQKLLSHELAHVVQQGGGGAAVPSEAHERGANAAAQAVASGRGTKVNSASKVGIAKQPRGLGGFGGPERTDDLPVVTHEDIAAKVGRIMNAPGAQAGAGRQEYKNNPKGARASMFHTQFRNDAERISFAYGVFMAELGEGADRDLVFAKLIDYETQFQGQNANLVVHSLPSKEERKQLDDLRQKTAIENAQAWDRGAEASRKLNDVTHLATPERYHPDIMIGSPTTPRQPVHGSVQGYRMKNNALQPADLLPKSDFNVYATDWERKNSTILVFNGMAPVVMEDPRLPNPPPGMPVSYEFPLTSHFGIVQSDKLFVPTGVKGGDPDTLVAVLANDLPVYAFSGPGKPLAPYQNYGDHRYLVRTDPNGKVIDLWGMFGKQEPGLISVMSPIDFIGPQLLARPLIGATRALARGATELLPEIRAAAGSALRKGTLSLELTMRGANVLPAISLTETPAAITLTEGGSVATSSVVGEEASAARFNSGPTTTPVVEDTHSAFAKVRSDLNMDALGTTTYRSTAAAAVGAIPLMAPDRLGFQTHSTAPSVRGALNRPGSRWQSVHMVFQAAYRSLLARGYSAPGGRRYSPGLALTTVDLSLQAHRAFDAGWVPQWNAAVAAGQTIRTSDVYRWLSFAINSVNTNLISHQLQGIILMRIRTELFQELGL